MSLMTVKFLAALAILAVAVLGGLIPLLAARGSGNQRFFSLGNAFAGGLFLGVGFMHLLPEGFRQLNAIEYPLGALMAGLGFAVLLLIDRVMVSERHMPEDGPLHYCGGCVTDNSCAGRSAYAYMLLMLLSIHSVIAGVSLGLEAHVMAIMVVLLGILCHKGSAAFALMVSAHGAELKEGAQWTLLATFAAMTPIGVLIGMFAANAFENDATTNLVTGVFNTLAAGTFIYVAIFHIIDTELSSRDVRIAKFVASSVGGSDDVEMPLADPDRVAKFALVVVGLALMAVLAAVHTH